jgi:iron-sulfur cluster assembly accessory protein
VLTVTDKAAEKAVEILDRENKKGWGIRIFIAGSGCCGPQYGLNLQEAQMPNDDVIEKNGLKIYIDKELGKEMSGMQLDYYKDDTVEGFVFTGSPPSSASCGSSCSSCG